MWRSKLCTRRSTVKFCAELIPKREHNNTTEQTIRKVLFLVLSAPFLSVSLAHPLTTIAAMLFCRLGLYACAFSAIVLSFDGISVLVLPDSLAEHYINKCSPHLLWFAQYGQSWICAFQMNVHLNMLPSQLEIKQPKWICWNNLHVLFIALKN